jgi:hypothetical protein
MRKLLLLARRAFPREHRARRSDEIVDTALLAADGSVWRAARESLSLVLAGIRERVRIEPHRSLPDGVALLAGVLALVNLAVALYGVSLAVHPPPPVTIIGPCCFAPQNPYVVDWWWIGFAIAAAGTVLGLTLGNRRLALGAALLNLGLVGYDALFVAANWWGFGHLNAVAYLQGPDGYPVGQEWLAPAAVLMLATALAPSRGRSVARLPLTLVAASLLVVVSRDTTGGFLFLRWPVAVAGVLTITLGAVAPRLAVVAVGISLALAPSVVQYLSTPSWEYKDPAVSWIAAPGLALGVVLPFAYLTRRRLT